MAAVPPCRTHPRLQQYVNPEHHRRHASKTMPSAKSDHKGTPLQPALTRSPLHNAVHIRKYLCLRPASNQRPAPPPNPAQARQHSRHPHQPKRPSLVHPATAMSVPHSSPAPSCGNPTASLALHPRTEQKQTEQVHQCGPQTVHSHPVLVNLHNGVAGPRWGERSRLRADQGWVDKRSTRLPHDRTLQRSC